MLINISAKQSGIGVLIVKTTTLESEKKTKISLCFFFNTKNFLESFDMFETRLKLKAC